MIRILFTGVGRRVELIQAFRDAALVLNKELKIYGADITDTAPALAYCDYSRITINMKDSGYIDNLLDICMADSIDLIIPTIDTDLLVLAENRDKFEAIGTKVMISAPDKIRICRDKNNTSQFFTDCGLHAPMPVNDWREYEAGYPAFIKPKDGSSSINAFKVENQEELEIYAAQVEDYIVQPFVDGREYTIDIFCDWDGEPVSIVPRERLKVRAGEVLKTKIKLDEIMIRESEVLCENFRPCGPMTVQLIRDREGIDRFIEINPRFGGGVPLSMKAGARSAESVLKLIDGENIEYCTDIADGAVYSRFDQSVCITNGVFKDKAYSSMLSTYYDSEGCEPVVEANQIREGSESIRKANKIIEKNKDIETNKAIETNRIIETNLIIETNEIKEIKQIIELNKIKGVIFDLDDTLYSEKEYVRSGYKAVSDYLGGGYEGKLWGFFEAGIPAIDELLKEIEFGCGEYKKKDKEKALSIYRSHKPDIHLYEGVTELVTELKSRGIKVGIITDGRPEGQRNKIEALGLESLVYDIIITDELGGLQFRKPCDIAFRIMQTRWRLNPTEIAYVGDNPNKDFQTPKQLGMKSIYFKNADGLYS